MLERNFSLKSLNTFGLDIKAAAYLRISEVKQLGNLPDNVPRPFLFLGGGSNMLFTQDYPGTVIHIDLRGRGVVEAQKLSESSQEVFAYAGENWHEFVRYTLQLNLGGLENLSLIPGNVGTAPVQNIGAYGVEIKDVLSKVEAWDVVENKLVSFDKEDCGFSYRNSFFKNEGKGRYIITKVFFRLSKNPVIHTAYGAIQNELAAMNVSQPDIHDVARAVIRIRMSKLPDPAILGNCGSFFKNPIIEEKLAHSLKEKYPDIPIYSTDQQGFVKISAGWLIEKAGWKGKAVGAVSMHAKQALVLTNLGSATGKELLEHSQRVKFAVKEEFNIQLEEEVNII